MHVKLAKCNKMVVACVCVCTVVLCIGLFFNLNPVFGAVIDGGYNAAEVTTKTTTLKEPVKDLTVTETDTGNPAKEDEDYRFQNSQFNETTELVIGLREPCYKNLTISGYSKFDFISVRNFYGTLTFSNLTIDLSDFQNEHHQHCLDISKELRKINIEGINSFTSERGAVAFMLNTEMIFKGSSKTESVLNVFSTDVPTGAATIKNLFAASTTFADLTLNASNYLDKSSAKTPVVASGGSINFFNTNFNSESCFVSIYSNNGVNIVDSNIQCNGIVSRGTQPTLESKGIMIKNSSIDVSQDKLLDSMITSSIFSDNIIDISNSNITAKNFKLANESPAVLNNNGKINIDNSTLYLTSDTYPIVSYSTDSEKKDIAGITLSNIVTQMGSVEFMAEKEKIVDHVMLKDGDISIGTWAYYFDFSLTKIKCNNELINTDNYPKTIYLSENPGPKPDPDPKPDPSSDEDVKTESFSISATGVAQTGDNINSVILALGFLIVIAGSIALFKLKS